MRQAEGPEPVKPIGPIPAIAETKRPAVIFSETKRKSAEPPRWLRSERG